MLTVKPCKFVIVDDDALIRNALRVILEGLGAEIAGEADNGRSAIEQAQLFSPEVILLDVSMPVMGGFDAARELTKVMPGVHIIFVSQHLDQAYVEEAFTSGAAAYVSKQRAGSDLADAVDAVMSGQTFISPTIKNRRH